ncbi:GntR family transcriptional regulator [Sphingomonas melonis]|uniref:DNA-binding GntR family transcriptional regulator n=1 Tax=Sphingomonas melonis TaxID=152682 RepID=A0A7Y9FL49_9SPHN|nr:GntR family transcriptional regulator [Sphingomonas melonis]NYD89128.1 DNA-binding GntR family transcriptional regulator [Sphingomonas melonis]
MSQQAYDRLEASIVTTELQPGSRTTLGELERLSGFGRTPVHDAVKRLSTARLIHVLPRSGLRIAPLDLEEERLLLPVRIEMEAIACKLAAQRADEEHVAQLVAAAEALRQGGETMTLAEFNVVDSELNRVILSASGEMMLGNTLLPLQTLYRRSGWLFHKHVAGGGALEDLVTAHLDLLDTILSRDPVAAEHMVRAMLSEVYSVLQKLQKFGMLEKPA